MPTNKYLVENMEGALVEAPTFPGWYPIGLKRKLKPSDIFITPFIASSSCREPPNGYSPFTDQCLHENKTPSAFLGLHKCNWMVYRMVEVKSRALDRTLKPVPIFHGWRALAWSEVTKKGDVKVYPYAASLSRRHPEASSAIFSEQVGRTPVQLDPYRRWVVYRRTTPIPNDPATLNWTGWALITNRNELVKSGDIYCKNGDDPSSIEFMGHKGATVFTEGGGAIGYLASPGYAFWRMTSPRKHSGNKEFSDALPLP